MIRPGFRALLFAAIGFCGNATAAPITLADLNLALPGLEADMESFFAIDYSGTGGPVSLLTDISFLPVITVPDPADYLSVDNFVEQEDLLEATNNVITPVPPAPVVTSFIVEAANFCGSFSVNTIGCADLPGHLMYLEGDDLLTNLGAHLWAHELGHNLGLDHVASSANLMHGIIDNSVANPALTEAQVNLLNLSSLIQGGTVTIQPILITSPVPLPPALLLFGLPAVLMTVLGSRRRGVRAA